MDHSIRLRAAIMGVIGCSQILASRSIKTKRAKKYFRNSNHPHQHPSLPVPNFLLLLQSSSYLVPEILLQYAGLTRIQKVDGLTVSHGNQVDE